MVLSVMVSPFEAVDFDHVRLYFWYVVQVNKFFIVIFMSVFELISFH